MCDHRALPAILGVASVMCCAPQARAQCQVNEAAKLLASDGAPGDQFGGAVALSGDTALIRAPGVEGSGRGRSSASTSTHLAQSRMP
ncbi:MAG: FG-GAP repeat protein [Phycisphaerales bacterium]|nr:MAG: FG-GAP repeat protein [Phycisphaerales bacterium]